jgi:histidyl-tRNA synthetase
MVESGAANGEEGLDMGSLTDSGLRYDLTLPLSRYYSNNANDLPSPFKALQMGNVWRADRPQRGRFREFYQSDIDIIGDTALGILNDAEIPSIIYQIFKELGIDDFTIRINNRKVLGGFFALIGYEDKIEDILRVVDKVEKIGKEAEMEELAKLGLTAKASEKLWNFISLTANIEGQSMLSNAEVISKLREIAESEKASSGADASAFEEGIKELEIVINAISSFGVPEGYYKIDLSIARGLDYYTGTVYETMLKKHPEIGSICSGGRYENLAGYYINRKLPGVGISIGLTRLFYILSEKKYVKSDVTAPASVLVIPMTDDFAGKTMKYAESLNAYFINEGIASQIYLEEKKFKAKMNYASSLKIPYVAIIGDDEEMEGTVALKNFETGEQVNVSKEQAANIVKKALDIKESDKIVNMQ